MTPKEKAEELFVRFNKEGLHQISSVINRFIRKQMIKQCALIAVEEMLKQHKKIIVSHNVSAYVSVKEFNTNLTYIQSQLDHYVLSNSSYWMQVKQEIEAL